MAHDEYSGGGSFDALPSFVVAAHELKSPLASLRQLILALEGDNLDEEVRRRLRRQLSQTTERALQLTNDLTFTANLNPDRFPCQPLNPLSVCRQLEVDMQALAQMYNHEIVWPHKNKKARQNTALVVANPMLLSRILANFLDNAMRYSQDGMPIELSVSRAPEQQVQFSVRDYGPMISQKEYDRMLDELESRKSTKTRPDSSGLGVFMAAQFARFMNGSIHARRHKDGMEFLVKLPMSQQMSFQFDLAV